MAAITQSIIERTVIPRSRSILWESRAGLPLSTMPSPTMVPRVKQFAHCADLLVIAFLSVACSAAPVEPAGTVLHGGEIVTLDPELPAAEVVAVRDGRIVAVGSDAEVLLFSGPETEEIDLGGRSVVPGLADNHFHVAAPSLVHYWGRERAEWVTPARAYLDAGIRVSSGTDAPVIPYNPWWTLYHFSTRDTISAGVTGADQAVGREEALRLATVENAYLTFEEGAKGTLEVGKLADMLVLDDDFLTAADEVIEDMRVLLTIVGGRIVYRATAW